MRSGSLTIAAGLLAALLGLVGCGADGPAASPGASGGSRESGGAATPGPSGDSSSPPDGVAPATGPRLHVGITSLRAPEGFRIMPGSFTGSDVAARSRDGVVSLFEIENAADVPTDVRVQAFLESQPSGARTRRLADVTLGQNHEPALRFAWTVRGDNQRYEAVLVYRQGRSISINFIIRPGLDRKQPRAVESVLASVRWL